MTRLEAAAKAYRECLAEYLAIEAGVNQLGEQIRHLQREQTALSSCEHECGARLITLRGALCEEAGK